MTTPQISENEIATKAFFLWLDEGCPQGRDQQHWHAAREELSAQALLTRKPARKAAAKKAAPRKPAARKAAAKPAKPAKTKSAAAKPAQV